MATWTDPTGAQQTYGTPDPRNLGGRARRSLEREEVWSGLDPTYDSQEFDVLPSGQIVKEAKYPYALAASMLAGPLAVGFLPGAAAASGGAGTSTATGAGGMGILGKIGSGIKNSFLDNPLGALGSLGTVLSGQAKGSADQRMSEGNLARDFGALNLLGARDQFNSGMDSAKFQREGQDRERKAAMLMSLLNGMQDLRLTPGNPKIAAAMGNVAGGARPSALTGNKEALLALLAQPQTQAPTYQAPTLPQMPTAGMVEKIMGGVGIGGSILGALGGLGGGKTPPVEDPMKKYADLGYATGY